MHHRNIFGSSSKVFGNLRQFSGIFGKCSETFIWPLEQFWKIFGNLRKVAGNLWKIIKNVVISAFIYIKKRTLHFSSKIWILRSRGKNNISLVRYCSCHSNIKFISSCHRVISSIYYMASSASGQDDPNRAP